MRAWLHEKDQAAPTVAVTVAAGPVDGADEGCAEPLRSSRAHLYGLIRTRRVGNHRCIRRTYQVSRTERVSRSSAWLLSVAGQELKYEHV